MTCGDASPGLDRLGRSGAAIWGDVVLTGFEADWLPHADIGIRLTRHAVDHPNRTHPAQATLNHLSPTDRTVIPGLPITHP